MRFFLWKMRSWQSRLNKITSGIGNLLFNGSRIIVRNITTISVNICVSIEPKRSNSRQTLPQNKTIGSCIFSNFCLISRDQLWAYLQEEESALYLCYLQSSKQA